METWTPSWSDRAPNSSDKTVTFHTGVKSEMLQGMNYVALFPSPPQINFIMYSWLISEVGGGGGGCNVVLKDVMVWKSLFVVCVGKSAVK